MISLEEFQEAYADAHGGQEYEEPDPSQNVEETAVAQALVDQFKATLSEKDMIRSIMSEEKANQRETVKIPSEKLRKFAPNANPQQLEDFVLKACEHYRKYLRRQRDAR